MKNYPEILGIHFAMSYEELETLMTKWGYEIKQCIPIDFLDQIYAIESKNSYFSDVIQFTFKEHGISKFVIIKWKEAFKFDDNKDITFTNIIEICRDYYLKDFTYEIIERNNIIYFKNTDWMIYFNKKYEEIIITTDTEI